MQARERTASGTRPLGARRRGRVTAWLPRPGPATEVGAAGHEALVFQSAAQHTAKACVARVARQVAEWSPLAKGDDVDDCKLHRNDPFWRGTPPASARVLRRAWRLHSSSQ
jgi:hypothetical protein